jgi:phosphoserine phosphatase
MGKVKLVCFDIAKTLILENKWVDLNLAMGIRKEEDGVLLHLFDEKIITYDEWQEMLTKIYIARGKAKYDNICKILYKFTYREGAREIIKYLKQKGYKVVIISGSIDLLVEKVAKDLDIDWYKAGNLFIFDGIGNLRNMISLGDYSEVKAHHLHTACEEFKLSLEECVCTGDGDNEKVLFDLTKHGITFKGSKLEKSAWQVIYKLNDIRKFL